MEGVVVSKSYLHRIGWCTSRHHPPFQAGVQLGELQSPRMNTGNVLEPGDLYPARYVYLDRATTFTCLATRAADIKDSKRDIAILPRGGLASGFKTAKGRFAYLYTLTCRPIVFHSGGFTSPSVIIAE